MQNDVEGSYASTCVIRCVSCVLPCLVRERCADKASERFKIERRLTSVWMKAFLLLSPDASRKSAILRRILRWPTEGVHRATDVEHVECSADLLEVKSARLSSKSSPWTTSRDALELLTTAETATSRRTAGTGLHLRPDRSDQQSTTRDLAQEVQDLSTSSAWCSGDCNRAAVTCRSTSVGAV